MAKGIDEDSLFDAPPESFVARRDALAKEALAAGEKKLAAEIRGRRKPTLVLWAANQAARRNPDGARELIEVSEELERAQRSALRGRGPGGDLREIGRRREETIGRLLRAGGQIAREAGKKGVDMTRLAGILHGISADPQARRAFAIGRLIDEVAPPGFDAVLGLLPAGGNVVPLRHSPTRDRTPRKTVSPPAVERRAVKDDQARRADERARARNERQQLREERERRKQDRAAAARAAREAEAARRRAEKLEREAAGAEKAAADAVEAAKGRRAKAVEARRAADDAAATAESARRSID
ncbi:MAG: hypothetical protein QOD06_944 [Candidatus Binatota bacterium]|nr:hypothetical protein [Candidatus Binatota bacterium]